MPTYEYQCSKCAHAFELFQSMTDKPVKKCPECGGAVKRLVGRGGMILFKGSGFYETDYKSKSSSATSASTSSSTESKPASSPKSESPKSDSPKPATDKK